MAVSAADANRNFSRLLGDVKRGQSVTITSHGRPVARLVPIDSETERHEKARAELLAHFAELDKQPMTIIGPWTREELHEF